MSTRVLTVSVGTQSLRDKITDIGALIDQGHDNGGLLEGVVSLLTELIDAHDGGDEVWITFVDGR